MYHPASTLTRSSGGFRAGEEIPADLDVYADFALPKPNTYQFLLQMLEDPDGVVEYMSSRCVDRVVKGAENLFFYEYLLPDQARLLLNVEGNVRLMQCTDNFGALDDLLGCVVLAGSACTMTVRHNSALVALDWLA